MEIMIKTSPKKKKVKDAAPKKRMETSKKFAWVSAMCFIFSLLYVFGMFTYCVVQDKTIDFVVFATIITVTGAAFGSTMCFYFNMNKAKNLYLIKRGFLKLKYLLLDKIEKLDDNKKNEEIEFELSKIEADFEMEEDRAKEDITYNN